MENMHVMDVESSLDQIIPRSHNTKKPFVYRIFFCVLNIAHIYVQ